MRAIEERLESEIAFRSKHDRIWNGGVDYRPFIAASLVFAPHYFGAKIGFALFQPQPASVLWAMEVAISPAPTRPCHYRARRSGLRGNLLLFQEVRCWISNLLPPFPFEPTAISYAKE
jgi:hypothetical protein